MSDEQESELEFETAAVIVAQPGDETLWVGGTMLKHAKQHWDVYTMTGSADASLSRKFHEAVSSLCANWDMASHSFGMLDPTQDSSSLQDTIMNMLGGRRYDLLFTHSPIADYEKGQGHEEVHNAVLALWQQGLIQTKELLLFAYETNEDTDFPQAIRQAHLKLSLRYTLWKEKYRNLTQVYGWGPESLEARNAPCWEAFWRFSSPEEYMLWENRRNAWTLVCTEDSEELHGCEA